MYNIMWTEQLISKNTCAYTNAYINVITTDHQRVYVFEGKQERNVGEFGGRKKERNMVTELYSSK